MRSRGSRRSQFFAAQALLFAAVLALTFGRYLHETFHGAAEHAATAVCAGTFGSETHWHGAAALPLVHLHGGDDALCPLCSGSLTATAAENRAFSAGPVERVQYDPTECRPASADPARHCRARAPPVC